MEVGLFPVLIILSPLEKHSNKPLVQIFPPFIELVVRLSRDSLVILFTYPVFFLDCRYGKIKTVSDGRFI